MRIAAALLVLVFAICNYSALSQAISDKGGSKPSAPVVPMKVSPGIMYGTILKKVPPVYPPEAKDLQGKRLGFVWVEAVIGVDGNVEHATLREDLSRDVPEQLWKAGVDAAKQYKYKPYLMNGYAVRVSTKIAVPFGVN